MLKPDEYSVGDLLHGRCHTSTYVVRMRIRGVVAAMRAHLKKANYHNFPNLMAAFKHYDMVRVDNENNCVVTSTAQYFILTMQLYL